MLKFILSFVKSNPLAMAGSTLLFLGLLFGGMYAKSYVNELEDLISKHEKTIKDNQSELKDKEKTIAIREAEIEIANAKISSQNEKIASIAIESEKLRSVQPIIKKEIETKYIKIKPPDTSSKCQAKLKYYENLFRELGR
ncbi:hypothetical protein [Campylobacter sp. RM16191]|uniref:hypothetical protein n=1 Tax=Campylobacter sp. RM16191 TaxID=1705728 RepID=UPI0014750D23|nr:hypothetical protein [Campylobacter sp. RM16191]